MNSIRFEVCKYINNTYALTDLNLRQMHMPVKLFAKMIKAIQKNRKLRYLNLQDNTLIDYKADKYDLYLLGLGADDEDGGHEEVEEPPEPKPNKKFASRKKAGNDKPKIKTREGPKINHEFILEALEEFMVQN